MRIKVNGCVINLKRMYLLPYVGRPKQIKIVGNTLYYKSTGGSLKDRWLKLDVLFQEAFQKYITEVEHILLGDETDTTDM